MNKLVSFSLEKDVYEKVQNKTGSRRLAKTLRNFIANQYELSDRTILLDGTKGDKVQPIRLDDNTIELLDQWVTKIGDECNRSVIMRDVFKQLLNFLEKQNIAVAKERKHSTFYFEKGTRSILEQFISSRDRDSTIELFFLNEYRLPKQIGVLEEKPIEPESIRINMDATSFQKLQDMVDKIGRDSISKTSIMRDVVKQLIEKNTSGNLNEEYAAIKFRNVIKEYDNIVGEEKVREEVEKYYK